MAKRCYKFYSVYMHGTDEPIIIHGSAKACAEKLGITEASLRCYLSHTRSGARKGKYEVYVDDPEDEDDAE